MNSRLSLTGSTRQEIAGSEEMRLKPVLNMSKVYVSQTKNIGKGLFAKVDIKKNEIIVIAKGVIVRDSYGPDYQIGPNWLAIGKNIWLNPFDKSSWRFINHSCNPNAGLIGKVTFVAMRNIRKDEEITIDYSITEEDPYWKMKCKCGEKSCRKLIRSIKFLSPKLFEKYKNYIPIYLRKSYTQANNYKF